jgi:hypothetical protein
MRKLAIFLFSVAALAGAGFFHARATRKAPVPENQAVNEIVAAAVGELVKAYPPGAPLVRRDAHAKAHGCVKATFQVDPALPQDLRVGTFGEPGRRYKALIRYSNASFHVSADQSLDGRGMAVKLIDSDPDKPDPARKNPPHDLLLVNFPAFFIPDVPNYHDFMALGALGGGFDTLKDYLFPGVNPFTWRWHAMEVFLRHATQKAPSPLLSNYYSMSPYRFGPGAIKYLARPCAKVEAQPASSDDPDYLRHALRRELQAAPACFELFVQRRVDNLSTEDLSQTWPESEAPPRLLGRIEIPAQDIAGEGRDAACENLSYNPGHAPTDQGPLGALNIARIKVYEAISAYRMGRNGVTPTDPEKAWDSF